MYAWAMEQRPPNKDILEKFIPKNPLAKIHQNDNSPFDNKIGAFEDEITGQDTNAGMSELHSTEGDPWTTGYAENSYLIDYARAQGFSGAFCRIIQEYDYDRLGRALTSVSAAQEDGVDISTHGEPTPGENKPLNDKDLDELVTLLFTNSPVDPHQVQTLNELLRRLYDAGEESYKELQEYITINNY